MIKKKQNIQSLKNRLAFIPNYFTKSPKKFIKNKKKTVGYFSLDEAPVISLKACPYLFKHKR